MWHALKHDAHYGPHSGFRYYNPTTSLLRGLSRSAKRRRAELICGFEPWNLHYCLFVFLMVFNATFNNISVISWRSVLLVEETGVPGENHRSFASHRQTLSHNVVLSTPRHERGFELTTSVVIGTDCTCTDSCKSNYYTITTVLACFTKDNCLYNR
jgi:hypothetical protein